MEEKKRKAPKGNLNPPGACYQKLPENPFHLPIRNHGTYISIPTKEKGSPAARTLFTFADLDFSELVSRILGRFFAALYRLTHPR